MKRVQRFLLLVCVSFSITHTKRTIVDEISAVVYCDGPRIIIDSESKKPDLDGRPRTLKDAIQDEIMLCEAQRFHITVTTEDVNKYMGELQKNNHMTRAGMERAMEELGYTYQEGLERLRRRQTVEQLTDNQVRGDARFLISKEEVAAFDNEHPVWEPAVYTLAEIVVDDPLAGEKEFSQKELDALAWEEPFDIKESQLADDKQFIADVPVGTVVFRDRLNDHQFELTRLIAKKPRRRIGLDDIVDMASKRTLYDFIIDQMRGMRYEEMIKDWTKELFEKSTIRFTHEYDQEKVLNTIS